jgi:hypothetical protein
MKHSLQSGWFQQQHAGSLKHPRLHLCQITMYFCPCRGWVTTTAEAPGYL